MRDVNGLCVYLVTIDDSKNLLTETITTITRANVDVIQDVNYIVQWMCCVCVQCCVKAGVRGLDPAFVKYVVISDIYWYVLFVCLVLHSRICVLFSDLSDTVI